MDTEFLYPLFFYKGRLYMKYNGLIISDIHIGAMSVNKIKEELDNSFLSYIKNTFIDKSLDFIIFLGDYFDHKLYMNDESSKYSSLFLNDLLNTVRDINSDCKIRFVYGTESHECDQYDTILNNISGDYDIKVIKHVSKELLFPSMKVLYIPEEHIVSRSEYYSEFFNEEYNYVFGHGVIREVMKEAAIISDNNKDSKRRKTPVFSTAELRKITKNTFFGHYHVNTEDDLGFHYVGSFSRWKFGEETSKGFYHVSFNDNKDEYKEKFIINELTESYNTISFGYSDKIFSSVDELDKKLTGIQNVINSEGFDHIKFRFNIPENHDNPEAYINYINEKFKYDDRVKVEISHGYIESKKKREKESIKEDNNKYSMIFDKSIPIEEKVSYFISLEYSKDISSRQIDSYLHKSLDEILK